MIALSTSPPPSGSEPPETLPRESRFIEWAQRVNGQYAAVLRWSGLAGAIVWAALGKPELSALFGGFIALSLSIGKPG